MALEATSISIKDAANVIYAQSSKKDAEIQDLLDRIDSMTLSLTSDATNDYKYRVLVSVEYIFARLRIVVETEAIKCKQLLTDANTPAILKTFFTKRSVYLAEVSAKLTLIRDDLNVLQRFQYNQQWQQK